MAASMGVATRTPASTDQRWRALGTRRPVGGRSHRLADYAAAGRGSNNFDLLRLLAATFVVFAHSFDLLAAPEPLMRTLGVSWGDIGVVIFFAISGFLVARSWVGEPRLLPFALKRALRLFPGLVVVLLLSALVLGPLVTVAPLHAYLSDPGTKAYVLNNLALQSNWDLPGVFGHNVYPLAVNGSLWTLPLEVKAYTFVALAGIAGLLAGRRRRFLLLAVPVYALLLCVPRVGPSLPAGVHFIAALYNNQMPADVQGLARAGAFHAYTDMFAAFTVGTALYVMRDRIALRWPYALLGVGAFAAAAWVGGRAPAIALAACGPYVILCIAYRTAGVVRLPRRLGDPSYGTYLYAFPVQQTISQLLAPLSGWVLFALALPVTLVLAIGSWHFVERPALDLKRRLTHSRDALPQVAT